jgi:hypothetical protein
MTAIMYIAGAAVFATAIGLSMYVVRAETERYFSQAQERLRRDTERRIREGFAQVTYPDRVWSTRHDR